MSVRVAHACDELTVGRVSIYLVTILLTFSSFSCFNNHNYFTIYDNPADGLHRKYQITDEKKSLQKATKQNK